MLNNSTKVRQSNIELLRIVSMFLVVMTHANLSSIGYLLPLVNYRQIHYQQGCEFSLRKLR